MTIPTITSVDAYGSNTAEEPALIPYPATDDGDLLIIFIGCDGSADTPDFPTGDWLTNVMCAETSPAGGHGYGVSYIIADGTETGNVEVGFSAGTEQWSAYIWRIKDWDDTTPPEITNPRVGDNGNDTVAVSLNPSWDSSSDDTLWIWHITNDGGDQIVDVFPTGFPGNRANNNPGAAAPNTGRATDDTLTATKSQAAGLDDLSSFDTFTCMIIGIRGAVAGGGTNTDILVPTGPLR